MSTRNSHIPPKILQKHLYITSFYTATHLIGQYHQKQMLVEQSQDYGGLAANAARKGVAMEKCFFCNKELSEAEVRLLDKPYLRVCLNCRNEFRLEALQEIRGKGEEVSRDGFVPAR